MRLDDPRLGDSFIGTFQLWPASALTLWKVNVSVGIQLDPKSDTAIFLRVGQRHSAVHLGMLLVAHAAPKLKNVNNDGKKLRFAIVSILS